MSRADALALASQGWRVFPTREKRPLTPGGFRDATASPPADWPEDAQIAIAIPQGVLVVDVDDFAGLQALEAQHGPLPQTLTAKSGKRGEHRYYRTNGTPTQTLTQRKLAPGVDTRIGGKGYVVAPPSIHHETGRPYTWQEPALPIADAPVWLLDALAPAATPPEAPNPHRSAEHLERAKAYLETVPPALEGRDSDGKGTTGGTHTFATAVRVVRGYSLTDDAAFEALTPWNSRCEPPWDDYGLRRKIHEAATRGDLPWGALVAPEGLHEAIRAGATPAQATQAIELDADAIFAPLPPLEYLVAGLGITCGPPAMIAGFGFSGKTAAAQQLAIDLAREDHAGDWMNKRPVWGRFVGGKRARVLHLDWEQGQNLTRRRYQRIVQAQGIDPTTLRGYLRLVPFPNWYTNTAAGFQALEKAIEGFDLVIVDSFRASNPGLEENSSEAREPLDAMARLSEKHGCAFLVIHHARKPSQDRAGGAVMAVRGSGAISDGCASILVFESEEKHAPKLVHHEKEKHGGVPEEDFALVVEGRAADGSWSTKHEGGPLRVRAQDLVVKTAEQVSNDQLQADVVKIRAYCATHGFFTNRDQLRAAMAVSTARVAAAVGDMITRGELVQSGSVRAPHYSLTAPSVRP